MITSAYTGLVSIELPSATILLCDGGYLVWNGNTFRSSHPTFGTISSVQPLGEGIGDEIPALELVMLPPSTAAIADLSQPGYQRSRCRFWLAQYVPETGAVVGVPNLLFDGQIDQTSLRVGRDKRELSISIVALVERLFEGNIGNSLSPSWHKSIWPGETGHDNATGLVLDIAWGTEKPTPTASTSPSAGQRPVWRPQ